MSEQDPATQVYNALWDMLEAHKGFTDLVRVGNRIKMSGRKRRPIKDEVSEADLPEVRIIPAGGEPHVQRTSNGSSLVKRFAIQVSTGEEVVDVKLFPVEWEIYRAMSKWAVTLQALKWNGRSFVNLARPLEITEGVSDSDLNRGIVGWSTVWMCEVIMWFTTADLA